LTAGKPEDILNADRNEFTEKGLTISISQEEERGLGGINPRREELEQALRDLAGMNDYDVAMLAVTDITSHYSMVLILGPEQVLAKIPFARIDECLFDAPGVVSRKKQLFPAISEAILHGI